MHGAVERDTEDLDFFSTADEDVAHLLPALNAALAREGLRVSVERPPPGFARLTVSDGSDTTRVDLGSDFRMQPPVRTPLGPVVSEEEVAADKMLTLFGRAEPRDFVDVFRLAHRFGLDRLCELAAAKDRGFSRERLAEALGIFERIEQRRFEVDEATFDELARWVRDLRELTPPARGADPPGLSL